MERCGRLKMWSSWPGSMLHGATLVNLNNDDFLHAQPETQPFHHGNSAAPVLRPTGGGKWQVASDK
ncbi:MAG TPA: hypothetical protein VEJ63_11440 [Planctomycetota bacterium]|nr:hypothetical protein [Planctomycetota bacterium]